MSAAKGKTKPPAGKVLRIGIIHGGKIIEERRLKTRQSVSIGHDDRKSTFAVSSSNVPKHAEIFEHRGGKYYVHLVPGAEGRIQSGKSPVRKTDAIKAESTTSKKGDAYVAPITDKCRGKVIFGDVTVLFQFVDPPMAPGKVVLPPEMRSSFISTIDVQFSGILVLVALMTISMASYAANQPYIEATRIEDVAEPFRKLIMPDRIPEPARDELVQEDDTGATKEKEKPKQPEPKKEKTKVASKGKTNGTPSKEASAKAKKEALSKAVAGKGLLGVIGTKGKGEGGAVADVFADGGDVQGDLGDAFSGIQGVDIAESSGQASTRGGGSGEAADIGDIGTEGGKSVKTGQKTETTVRGTVNTQTPEVEGDLSPSKIKSAMRKYVSGVKDCYERALKRDPKLRGKIVIGFEILESGKISEFDFRRDSVGSSDVQSCIKRRSRSWRFPRPDGGSVYVEFPILFEPSTS